MTNNLKQKLKNLTQVRTPDVPLLSTYLETLGISRNLQQQYRRNGWLERIGFGAYMWPGDNLDWQGVLYSLQVQLGMNVHVGARSALSLAGYSHYFRTEGEEILLFSRQNRALPRWVSELPCSANLLLCYTGFLMDDSYGINSASHKTFELRVSSPERAILETLYLTPKRISYTEAYQLMENLMTLRPDVLQKLLGNCGSVKVKRLFMLFASRTGHTWAKRLDTSRISMGDGARSLAKQNGVYVADYKIVVPKELVDLWH